MVILSVRGAMINHMGLQYHMILVKLLEVIIRLYLLGALGQTQEIGIGSVSFLIDQVMSEVIMTLGLHYY